MTEQVIIEFIPDFTKLETGLDQVAKSGKVDVKGFTDIQNAIDNTATDTKGLITQFKNVAGASIKMGKTIEDAFGAGLQDALDEAGVSVNDFEKALKKVNQPAITVKKELMQLKEAMARMKAEGKDTGKEFDALRLKAGKLADAVQDANAEIKNAGSDTRGIDNVVGSISALAGGYAAVQGAAALFGEENEDLQKALLKVNAAMAIAVGIQQVATAVQKEGALTKLADSVATGAQTAAQRIYAMAVGTSTGAMKVFRIALLATGIGAVVVLLGLAADAMGLFSDNTDKGKLSTDDFNKALDDQNKLLDKNIDALETAAKLSATRRAGSLGTLGEALEEIKVQKKKLDIMVAAELQARKDANRNDQMQNQVAIDNINRLADAVQAQSDKIKQLEVQAIADQERREKEAEEKRLDAQQKARDKAIELLRLANLKLLKEEEEYLDKVRKLKYADKKNDEKISAEADKKELDRKKAFYKKMLEAFKESQEDFKKEIDAEKQQRKDDNAAEIAEDQAKLAQQIKNTQIIIDLAQRTASVFISLAAAQTAKDAAFITSKRREVEEQLRAGVITAKAAIARQKEIDEFERRARNKAAEREKKAAVFQALISIPQAFLQGLTSAPPPYGAILGAIAAALAAVQAGIIISQPVPKFFRGKKGSYSGPGIVGDMGSELVERNGRMFLYTKPTETYLSAKDKVYTAGETKKILHNTNISTTIKPAPAEKFDYNRFAKAIPANAVNINIDKEFITESVAKGLTKNNYMDRRYSSR